MPFIFIHGVNVRDTDEGYQTGIAARNLLIERRLLGPLAELGARFQHVEITNPYWGKHGVDFRYKLQSLPDVRTLEHLGGADGTMPRSDIVFTETARELAGTQPGSRNLEQLGAQDGLLRQAAEKDLTRFVEAVLTPVLLAEMRLGENSVVTPEQEGTLQALLAMAAYDTARNPQVQAAVQAAASDDALVDLLKHEVQTCFEAFAQKDPAFKRQTPNTPLEALGPGWFDDLRDRVGELFDRIRDAPARAIAIPALDLWREQLHRNFSRFFGDIFVYLNERGDAAQPGPIVVEVLQQIQNARKHHNDEPLIIMTHSMGGNILYDILTYYAPDLSVDAWISVGGQVGQFEEMSIFKRSDKAILPPTKVAGLKPRVRYWLNVYDPGDPFGFKAAPVFGDVDADVPYLTGASTFKAHGEYFGRASFYDMVLSQLKRVLR
jgi:hypothetical protein